MVVRTLAGDAADGAEVEFGADGVAIAAIGAPRVIDGDHGRLRLRLEGPGVCASGWIEFEGWSGGVMALPAFLNELATDWRGWDGAREWRDSSGTVDLSATHDRVGRVMLRCSLRTLPYDPPASWRVVMEIPLEPGELEVVAAEVGDLVGWGALPFLRSD